MDRLSGLASAAAGLRMFPESRINGYVQLGIGIEMTKISAPMGDQVVEDKLVLPLGFIGIGTLKAEPEMAAQGQFYLKYAL